jgi:hypothetical protein
VDKLLADLRARSDQHPRNLSFIGDALDRADRLAADGKSNEARDIWNGVVALYADEPSAAIEVERARRNLAALKHGAPSATAPPKSDQAASPSSTTTPKTPAVSGQGAP